MTSKMFAGWQSIAALILSALLCGCEDIDNCGRYRDFVDDPQQRAELLDWADREVFARSFSRDDRRPVSFRNYDPRLTLVTRLEVPRSIGRGVFGRDFVQVMGKDLTRPDLVFIGGRPYRGLIIGRSAIEESWHAFNPRRPPPEILHDRVALVCISPLD